MGYEVMAMIGRLEKPEPAYKEDLENPFDDGSGYPYLKDEDGNRIPAGHMEQYFSLYAQIDLSKIAYGGNLSKTIKEYREKTKEQNSFPYCYPGFNARKMTKDPYGETLVPIPLETALEAVKKEMETDDYRRLRWFKELLETMKDEKEDLVCVFYGY